MVKDVLIEVTKQCRVKTKDGMKECGVGSVVMCPEPDAKYTMGLGKAKPAAKGAAEKIVALAPPKPESKAAEPKKEK